MNTEKKSSNSVLRRLIPAVAMFAASTVMLSTATYAWFTMNKEVQMTGLKMSATASEGIEISLGGITGSTTLDDPYEQPGDNDTSWKSLVEVGAYYSTVGQLRPASTVNGSDFYDAKDASNKGKVANSFKSVNTKANLEKRVEYSSGGDLQSGGDAGYYVDIPVHIRTSKVASTPDEKGNIYCKLVIKDSTDTGKELYKAVRVTFIPTDLSGSPSGDPTGIFGADAAYYDGGAVSGESSKTAVTVTVDCVSDSDFDSVAKTEGEDSGLDLPYATNTGSYGHLDFIVRVWLEGQSTSCFDDNSGQSWNIDFAFSLGEFQTT